MKQQSKYLNLNTKEAPWTSTESAEETIPLFEIAGGFVNGSGRLGFMGDQRPGTKENATLNRLPETLSKSPVRKKPVLRASSRSPRTPIRNEGDPEKAAEAKIRFEVWETYKERLRTLQEEADQNLFATLESMEVAADEYINLAKQQEQERADQSAPPGTIAQQETDDGQIIETRARLEAEVAELLSAEAGLQLEIEAQRELFGPAPGAGPKSPRKKGKRKPKAAELEIPE
jgi:hypothetical protein